MAHEVNHAGCTQCSRANRRRKVISYASVSQLATSLIACQSSVWHAGKGLGLLLGTEAPVITPNGVDFSFFLKANLYFAARELEVEKLPPKEDIL